MDRPSIHNTINLVFSFGSLDDNRANKSVNRHPIWNKDKYLLFFILYLLYINNYLLSLHHQSK